MKNITQEKDGLFSRINTYRVKMCKKKVGWILHNVVPLKTTLHSRQLSRWLSKWGRRTDCYINTRKKATGLSPGLKVKCSIGLDPIRDLGSDCLWDNLERPEAKRLHLHVSPLCLNNQVQVKQTSATQGMFSGEARDPTLGNKCSLDLIAWLQKRMKWAAGENENECE